MDKDKCIKILNDLRSYKEYEDKLVDLGINFTLERNEFSAILTHLTDYLGNELGSVDNLDYFIYDLEFGSAYTEDSVSASEGNSMYWSSIEKFVDWCEKKRSKN